MAEVPRTTAGMETLTRRADETGSTKELIRGFDRVAHGFQIYTEQSKQTEAQSKKTEASMAEYAVKVTNRITKFSIVAGAGAALFMTASAVVAAIQQARQDHAIESLQVLAVEVRQARDEAKGAREDARAAATEASEAREELKRATPNVEIIPPKKAGEPARAVLKTPARKAAAGQPAAPAATFPIGVGTVVPDASQPPSAKPAPVIEGQ